MADASGEPNPRTVFLFAILLIVVHVADFLFFRRSGVQTFAGLLTTLLFYTVLAFMAQGVLKDRTMEPFAWFFGMWAMPIAVGFLIKSVGATSALGRMVSILVIFFPLFIFYFMRRGQLSGLLIAYLLIWIFGYGFTHAEAVQQFAGERGFEIPYNPTFTYQYLLEWTWDQLKYLAGLPVKAITALKEEAERSIAMAKGDYYTGSVDAAAQKRLGVYLDNFRTTEPTFYEDMPVTAFVTMKAETLDQPLDITITCTADDNITASRILPKGLFNVISTDQYDIDCIWNKGVLAKGPHTLALRSEFKFSTRAYLKTYMMDRDRLREYRRQNVDPLADVPDKNPTPIYTSGPVRIGMGLGQQPIALGEANEVLPPWGITIENAWEGKILDITGVYLIIPKGIEIKADDTETLIVTSACTSLPAEEQAGCDDSLVNVYEFTVGELSKDIYKNLTTKNFRAYLTLKNPRTVLGNAPIAVQNFKVSVQYRYMLERTVSASVREVQQ